MSLLAYKVLHLIGAFLLFAALGVLALRPADRSKLATASHGVALLLIVVSGFGLLARLGIMQGWDFPLWVWLKLAIWLLLGGALVLVKRIPRLATLWWWLFPLLGGAAAYLALYKPV